MIFNTRRIIIKNNENNDFSLMIDQDGEIHKELATIVFDWFLPD